MSRQVTEAALARIVMPRSRSWSSESMTRSTSCWWARNTPVARSMRVDERGLAVVDVGHQRDVAKSGGCHGEVSGPRREATEVGLLVLVVGFVVVVELDPVLGR